MRNFNSRPHEEVDLAAAIPDRSEFDISTHDLTRRSTQHAEEIIKFYKNFNSRPHEEVDKLVRGFQYCDCISTHDLTRRST